MALMILFCLLTVNDPLAIDIWVDKEDATYYPTENLKVFFQTNQDCFIAVYNIEVGGRENLLFPLEDDKGWVDASRTYELPPETADYDYVISGPEGIETIVAIASAEQLPTLHDEVSGAVREAVEIYIKEPEPANLRLISTPKDCRIYITEVESDEQEYVGETPRTIVLRPGDYVVQIKKSGYRTLSRRIWLDPGERRRVFVKLKPY